MHWVSETKKSPISFTFFSKKALFSTLECVQAWIEIHKDELLANWELAVAGEELFNIAPLR